MHKIISGIYSCEKLACNQNSEDLLLYLFLKLLKKKGVETDFSLSQFLCSGQPTYAALH